MAIMPQKFSDKSNDLFWDHYDFMVPLIIIGSLIGATAVRVLFPGLMESTGVPVLAFMLTAGAIAAVLCLLRWLVGKCFQRILQRKQNQEDEDLKEKMK